MSERDPIADAVSGRDPACPDGRALARLGALLRDAGRPPRAVSLAAGLRARIARQPAADAEALDGDLAELIRDAGRPPRPVDLRARVRAAVAASRRIAVLPGGRAWRDRTPWRTRIWQLAVAGHIAALVAVAIIAVDRGPGAAGGAGGAAAMASGDAGTHAIRQPATWTSARAEGSDLLLLRRVPELREAARRQAGWAATAGAVDGGLAWLAARQDRQGLFCHGDPAADDRALAAQAAAVLALLGEGLGDPERTRAAKRGLERMLAAWTPGRRDPVAEGLACWATVEGAILLGDPGLHVAAAQALAAQPRPLAAGGAGLGGFRLLAVRLAMASGLAVDAGLAAEAEAALAAAAAAAHPSAQALGRWAALTQGLPAPRFAEETPPAPAAGAGGQRVDPLAWFFPTLARHAAGGRPWDAWSADLAAQLHEALRIDPAGGRRVDAAAHIDGPDAPVLATSLALLCLQVPYRFVAVR